MNPDACTLGFVYTQGNPNIKAEACVQTSGFKCGGSEGGLALTTDCSPLFKKMFGVAPPGIVDGRPESVAIVLKRLIPKETFLYTALIDPDGFAMLRCSVCFASRVPHSFGSKRSNTRPEVWF